MLIRIKGFSGVMPTINPTELPDNAAQVATNCAFWSNDVAPLYGFGPAVRSLDKLGAIKSIYRFGQEATSESDYWFHWTTDVDVVRGMVFGDTTEKTYFTGDGAYPKYTDSAVALSGTQYPSVSYRLGVPVPTAAPTLSSVTGTVDGTASAISVVYTFVDDNDWEGAPSPALGINELYQGQTVNLAGFEGVVSGYRMSSLSYCRVYVSDTNGAFRYVGRTSTVGIGTTFSFVYNADSISSGDLISTTFDPPPATLKGLTGLHNGMMAGFTGIDVYICEAYKPWAWSTDYVITTEHPVVALSAFDQTLVILTKGLPVVAPGSDPASFTPLPLKGFRQACVSKRSVVQIAGGVMYACPDGMAFISAAGSQVVTAGGFARAEWQALKPESIVGFRAEDRYVGFYDTGTKKGAFLLDMGAPRQPFTFIDLYATAGYNDLLNDGLYLVPSGANVVRRLYGGAPLRYTWRSKKFKLSAPSCMTWARVLCSSPVGLTLRVYGDGQLVDEVEVEDERPFRLSTQDRYRVYELEITGTTAVTEIAIASTSGELANG